MDKWELHLGIGITLDIKLGVCPSLWVVTKYQCVGSPCWRDFCVRTGRMLRQYVRVPSSFLPCKFLLVVQLCFAYVAYLGFDFFPMTLDIWYRESYSGSCHIDCCGGDWSDSIHILGCKERPWFQLPWPLLVWCCASSHGLCSDSGIMIFKHCWFTCIMLL